MSLCFDAPVTGYRQYSEAKRHQEAGLPAQEIADILLALATYANLDVILDAIAFADDLNRLPVLESHKAAGLLSDMARLGLLEHGNGQMYKTKKFSEFYRAGRQQVSGTPKERF